MYNKELIHIEPINLLICCSSSLNILRFSLPRTPLRQLKPGLFQKEYETESDDTDSEGIDYTVYAYQYEIQF